VIVLLILDKLHNSTSRDFKTELHGGWPDPRAENLQEHIESDWVGSGREFAEEIRDCTQSSMHQSEFGAVQERPFVD